MGVFGWSVAAMEVDMRIMHGLLLFAWIALSGCYYYCGCDYEMQQVRRKYGWPDHRTTTKSSSGQRAEHWSYESRWGPRRSFTFEWSRYGGCHCEVIRRTYSSKEAVPEVERWQSSGKKECALCPPD